MTRRMDLLYITETSAEGLIRIAIIRYIIGPNRELILRPTPTAVSSRLSVTDLTAL